MATEVPVQTTCYHCGLSCNDDSITTDNKSFCCSGCLAVYQLLSNAKLNEYYKPNENIGIRPTSDSTDRFAYLDTPEICEKLFGHIDSKSATIHLHIPQIHCASCIWLLENLHMLASGIRSSRASLVTHQLTIQFDHTQTSLRKVVELLAKLGYEPNVSLEGISQPKRRNPNWKLYAKLGVAGFAFSNIMLFSIPEYLAAHGINDSYLSRTFRYASLFLALPVLVYSAGDYFRSALMGLRHRTINLDVPLALGIAMLFLRSAYDILFGQGPGYLDSFTGLVFVLLVGKLFQQYTFEKLSFDKNYRSYFPISCLKREAKTERVVHIGSLRRGDHVIVRNNEIIPADSLLISGRACIDYAFVTGESTPQEIDAGQRLFAGGRQIGGAIELEVMLETADSYLISLWGNQLRDMKQNQSLRTLADTIAGPFTSVVLVIAAATGVFWWIHEPSAAIHAVTSVLLVACPCALALAGPFVLGTAARIWGEKGFFLRNANVVGELSRIDNIVFDKTGTLTRAHSFVVEKPQSARIDSQHELVASLTRLSTHPVSRAITRSLKTASYFPVHDFKEIPGEGIRGMVNDKEIRVGNARWCSVREGNVSNEVVDSSGVVHVAIDGVYIGSMNTGAKFRESIPSLLDRLKTRFSITVLSGDTRQSEKTVRSAIGEQIPIQFECTPQEKQRYIQELTSSGKRTIMLGDGLNDAGAIGAASVGISVTEDISSFTPACDGILDANTLGLFDRFLRMAKRSQNVIIAAYTVSLIYNVVGLTFAVTGHLSPFVSAILMPVSSITVVLFATSMTRLVARQEGLR